MTTYEPKINTARAVSAPSFRLRVLRAAAGGWNTVGRQALTVGTVTTAALASISGLTMIARVPTAEWWLLPLMTFANIAGLVGVAVLSWRTFTWRIPQ